MVKYADVFYKPSSALKYESSALFDNHLQELEVTSQDVGRKGDSTLFILGVFKSRQTKQLQTEVKRTRKLECI